MYLAHKIVASSCRYDEQFSSVAIGEVDKAMDRVMAFLGVQPTFAPNAALVERHGQSIARDAKGRARVLKAFFPVLNAEHLILSNVFTAGDYLSSERFTVFKDFLELSPFGKHKKELYNRLSAAGFDLDTLHFPCKTEEVAKPSEHVAAVIALFLSLFANAKGFQQAAACRTFDHYAKYRDLILSGFIGVDFPYHPSWSAVDVENGDADVSLDMLDKLFHALLTSLIEEHNVSVSPFHRMCAIFSEKSPYASMHHNGVKVNGVDLAHAFAEERFDSVKFTRNVIQSPWFNKDDPEKSRFFTDMTSFGKPMFGVFSDAELDELKAGIADADSADIDPTILETIGSLSEVIPSIERSFSGRGNSDERGFSGSFDFRKMYHELINKNVSDSLDELCRNYIEQAIAEAKNGDVSRDLGEEFCRFPYSRDRLSERLDAIYQSQMEVAEAVNSVDLDMDTLRSIHFTYAPTAFVDGCWLENVPKILRYDRNVTRVLFDVYNDELGQGVFQYNHARIYSDLLKDLRIDLPHHRSPEFSENASIVENGFRGPVFMLALARNIDRFFPELLGYTLSTELFGLGGFYQYLLKQLQKNKIDGNFYSIHISVDNLSTGHSALAAKAVVNFMEEVSAMVQSKDMSNVIWNRVWDGFLASRYMLK